MNSDEKDLEIFAVEDGEPSAEHDEVVMKAIDRAGDRIASRRVGRSRKGWLIATVALAASVLLVPTLLVNQSDPLRNAGSNELVNPPNAAELQDAPSQLSWPQQSNATGYRVTLRDLDSNVVFSAETRHPVSEVSLGTETKVLLESGGTFLWNVQVEDSMKSELGPYWFSLQVNDAKSDQ